MKYNLEMTTHSENKRKVLIAITDTQNQNYIAEQSKKNISNPFFYFATDGMEAISKMINDPPHVFIVEQHLPKKNAYQIVEHMLTQKKFDRTAIIILSGLPEEDQFIDEVVMGKVQFTSNFGHDIASHLNRALNFVSHGDNTNYRMTYINSGETLMKEGDAATHVYILKTGELQAVTNKSGSPVVLGKIQPGEFVGEMAYINGEPRSASIQALKDCELIEIPVNKLDNMLFQKPAWAKALMKTLTKRIQQSNQRLVNSQ